MSRSLHLKKNNNPRPEGANGLYSCYMTSMGHGGNLRYDFDPDPTQITWGLTANIQTKNTLAGQISYSTGRTIGPLQIVGYQRSRWDLKELGDFVSEHMNEGVRTGAPLRFVYPERNIDYLIYIQSLNDVGYDGESGEICAYAMTAAVTQDHSHLSNVKRSILIDNPQLESVEWIDAKRAYEIAEERFGGIIGSLGSGGGAEDSGDGGGNGGNGGGNNNGGNGNKPADQQETAEPSRPPKDRQDPIDRPVGEFLWENFNPFAGNRPSVRR